MASYEKWENEGGYRVGMEALQCGRMAGERTVSHPQRVRLVEDCRTLLMRLNVWEVSISSSEDPLSHSTFKMQNGNLSHLPMCILKKLTKKQYPQTLHLPREEHRPSWQRGKVSVTNPTTRTKYWSLQCFSECTRHCWAQSVTGVSNLLILALVV